MSVKTKMTAIANKIRELLGTTDVMGLDTMATNLGEANTEVSNQAELIAQIASALEGKASGSNVELPELTNPASQEEVFLDKEFIDEGGNVKTGTFTIENELTEQDSLIAQIQSVVNNLPEAGGNGGGGSSETGICPSLTVTSNGIRLIRIYIPNADGTYTIDQDFNRESTVLYNILINKPIIIGYISNFELGVESYTNLDILAIDEAPSLLFIKCNSTSPATLNIYDND